MERHRPGCIKDHWDLAYRHSAGANGTRFLKALRDDRVLLTRSCAVCGKRSLPPCDCPDHPHTTWRQLSGAGSLLCATQDSGGQRTLLAAIALDDCDTLVLQRLLPPRADTEDEKEIATGTRVRAVFATQRAARMTDFWFEIAG